MPGRKSGPSAKTLERERMFAAAMPAMNFNGAAAAVSVGYAPGPAAGTMAHKFMQSPRVQGMIAEYVGVAVKKSQLTLEALIEEYRRVAFANIDDYMVTDDDGIKRVDLSHCTKEQLAAISEITTTVRETRPAGDDVAGLTQTRLVNVKIKLHPKLDAMAPLFRYLSTGSVDPSMAGAVIDNRTQVVNFNGVTPEQASQEYMRFIKGPSP